VITELAILNVCAGLSSEFELAFAKAKELIVCQKGYINHTLTRCIEVEDRYLLLVNWEALEDHTVGFRTSSEYKQWSAMLHGFYDPFPTVEHYQGLV
jgi:heme-degrading monooxygenase HmoA